MFWSFVMIYVFCEMGEMVTNQFEMFERALGQCNWYLFSMKLQRIHLIVVANAQQPTIVHGFGNIVCIRESMKQVILLHKTAKFNTNSNWTLILPLLFHRQFERVSLTL